MVVDVGRIWYLKRDFKRYLNLEISNGISLGDFKIISQRDILNNIPTWRYYKYKLIEIFSNTRDEQYWSLLCSCCWRALWILLWILTWERELNSLQGWFHRPATPGGRPDSIDDFWTLDPTQKPINTLTKRKICAKSENSHTQIGFTS